MRDQANDTSAYLNDFFRDIVSVFPKILGALVILLIGYIVARVIAAIIRKALEATRLNNFLFGMKGGDKLQKAVPNPSQTVSRVAYWLIFLFAISIAPIPL